MEKPFEPFVFHSNSKHKSGIRVTVIGEYVNGVLNLAASRCGKHDPFVKKDGRKIATERLELGKFITSFQTDTISIKLFIGAACAVAESVINRGVDKKIILIKNEEVDGRPLDVEDQFSWVKA